MEDQDNLFNSYFHWLCGLVMDGYDADDYSSLLWYLFTKEFRYSFPNDANRESDGTDLRYRYGYEFKVSGPAIAACLDDRPCSVLEMMIALCLRCEEQIMSDSEYGDRTGVWFMAMLRSLGIATLRNGYFNSGLANYHVERFLDREYRPNGEGGLFTIPSYPRDMRNAEIWSQAMWWFNRQMGLDS